VTAFLFAVDVLLTVLSFSFGFLNILNSPIISNYNIAIMGSPYWAILELFYRRFEENSILDYGFESSLGSNYYRKRI